MHTTRARLPGFTLIELLVVMTIISLLLTLAVPRYFHSVEKSKETVLRDNLSIMRESLDKYYADTGRYPDELGDLVTKKYLRSLPRDPITESTTTWVIVAPADASKGAIYDIKSGAPGQARDGSLYADW
jgi:general secretion pathway protein G